MAVVLVLAVTASAAKKEKKKAAVTHKVRAQAILLATVQHATVRLLNRIGHTQRRYAGVL